MSCCIFFFFKFWLCCQVEIVYVFQLHEFNTFLGSTIIYTVLERKQSKSNPWTKTNKTTDSITTKEIVPYERRNSYSMSTVADSLQWLNCITEKCNSHCNLCEPFMQFSGHQKIGNLQMIKTFLTDLQKFQICWILFVLTYICWWILTIHKLPCTCRTYLHLVMPTKLH